MIAAFVYHDLKAEAGLPTPVALAIVLLVLAPLVGLGLERTMRSFRGAAPGTTLTVTIALTILLIGVAQYLFQARSEEHTSELQSLMRISYAVFCLKQKQPHQQ